MRATTNGMSGPSCAASRLRNAGTTSSFTQAEVEPTEAESVGPGWEYYLDRLVAAVSDGEVAAINWDRDYYPAMVEHYRSQFG